MGSKETQPTTEVGKQLEKERINRGLTKEAWCDELQIKKPTYLAWLTRPVDIEFINIRRIAVVMGVTPDTVFGWIEVDVPIIHVIPGRRKWDRRPIDIAAVEETLVAAA